MEEVDVGVGWRGMGEHDGSPIQGWRRSYDISQSKKLVIEGKATVRKTIADVDEQYRVEFVNRPGMTYERFVDTWGQNDPVEYLHDFNRRSAGLAVNRFEK